MKIVVDTNVLVSALIRAEGIPARILDVILTGQVKIVLDHRIYAEYHDVLLRPEFGFAPEPVDNLLDFLLPVWRTSLYDKYFGGVARPL